MTEKQETETEKEWSRQEQLAERASVSRSLISSIEAAGIAKSFSLEVFYRFSNMYAKRTGQSARLIIREGSGYRRNPNLKITTDIEQFDLHLKAAESP